MKNGPMKNKMTRFSKSEKLTIDPKAIALEKWSIGSKSKIVKNMPKTTLESVVLCEKRLQKTPNIRKIERFLKSEKLLIDPKAVALENLSIGSKFKMV